MPLTLSRNGKNLTTMNPKIFLSYILLLFVLPVSAREKSDALVMRNGDRLTCEIKSLDSDTLSISLDYASGSVSINWAKVDHIESKQLFLVKTQDGLVYSGSLSTPATPGARPTKIEVLDAPATKVELDKTDVIMMQETDRGFWSPFNGQIGLSTIYNKGNQSFQYSTNANVNYARERWGASASYNSSLSSIVALPLGTRSRSPHGVSCAGTIGTTQASLTSSKVPNKGSSFSPPSEPASAATLRTRTRP